MDKLRELVAKWRARADHYSALSSAEGYFEAKPRCYKECADELEAALASQPEAQAPQQNEIDLVNLVLSAHQTAYAQFHCAEGKGVIESHDLAIGYASVELAKALSKAKHNAEVAAPQVCPACGHLPEMCDCMAAQECTCIYLLDGTLDARRCKRHKKIIARQP